MQYSAEISKVFVNKTPCQEFTQNRTEIDKNFQCAMCMVGRFFRSLILLSLDGRRKKRCVQKKWQIGNSSKKNLNVLCKTRKSKRRNNECCKPYILYYYQLILQRKSNFFFEM